MMKVISPYDCNWVKNKNVIHEKVNYSAGWAAFSKRRI